jgi:hypothetical protein
VEISFISWFYTENDTLPFVIPTEAYPDFLPRSTGQSRVCVFL